MQIPINLEILNLGVGALVVIKGYRAVSSFCLDNHDWKHLHCQRLPFEVENWSLFRFPKDVNRFGFHRFVEYLGLVLGVDIG